VVTDPQTQEHTNKQTGPITIHCAAARSVITAIYQLQLHAEEANYIY